MAETFYRLSEPNEKQKAVLVDLMADKIDDPKVSVEELKKVMAAKMEQLSSIESKQRNKESEGGGSKF